MGGIEWWEAVVFGFTTASVLIFYIVSQRELYPDWKWRLRDLPFILALGIGMCINNATAVTEGLLAHESPFVRTAKYRIETVKDRWKTKMYRSTDRRTVVFELGFAIYMCVSFAALVVLKNWGALPYLLLFVTGYVYVLGLSVLHGKR
jgi:hypothetical protein